MESLMDAELENLLALSLTEKLQLVEALWDNIAASAADVPVLDWQKRELAARKAAYTRRPRTGRSWEEVRESIGQSRG
jgi:putative addiction module component (TIGR02574 family)